jgi:hypothetical protein
LVYFGLSEKQIKQLQDEAMLLEKYPAFLKTTAKKGYFYEQCGIKIASYLDSDCNIYNQIVLAVNKLYQVRINNFN